MRSGEPLKPRGLAEAQGPRTVGDWVRFGLRGVGQTLITLGLVLLLLVVYEVYVSNISAHRKQVTVHKVLERQWSVGEDPLALPSGSSASLPAGVGIANLYLPRLGKDYAWTVVEGTNDADLQRGPGHYSATALPGQIGNFAVAGHRVGKGEPFLNLDHLRAGDAVIVETLRFWYVYRVLGDVASGDLSATGPDGIPGREIVDPSDATVIAPDPDHSGQAATEKLMTMTTCTPKFSASQRLVVHARLDPSLTIPRTSDTQPAAIAALYEQVS
jgi:sortase A